MAAAAALVALAAATMPQPPAADAAGLRSTVRVTTTVLETPRGSDPSGPHLAIDPTKPRRVHVVAQTVAPESFPLTQEVLWRTKDGGRSWSRSPLLGGIRNTSAGVSRTPSSRPGGTVACSSERSATSAEPTAATATHWHELTLRFAAQELIHNVFVDAGKPGPSVGDSIVEHETLFAGGRRIGHDTLQCTVIHPPAAIDVQCVGTLVSAAGRLRSCTMTRGAGRSKRNYRGKRPASPGVGRDMTAAVLFRRLLGATLRRARQRQSRTLREVSEAAGVSLGYLSEVERGRKEASAELLVAICTALGLRLADVLRMVGEDLARVEPMPAHAEPVAVVLRPDDVRVAA